jgi:thymidylate synthase (FAD)
MKLVEHSIVIINLFHYSGCMMEIASFIWRKEMKRPQNDYMDSQIGVKHDVLDKGYLIVVDYMGDEEKIARSARVSYGDGTTKKNNDAGLIKHLVRNHHETPIEQVCITFEMKLPMFVLGQVIRHRIMSPNVMSARYSVMPDEFYVPSLERIKGQHATNKQMSGDDLDDLDKLETHEEIINGNSDSNFRYTKLLNRGLARELSRGQLNQFQYTKMVCTFNMRSLMNFMYLRKADDAQWEIQQYANVLCDIVKGWMPNLWDAFEDYRLDGMQLSRKQQILLNEYIEIRASGDIIASEDIYLNIKEKAEMLGMSKSEIRETIEKFERLVG